MAEKATIARPYARAAFAFAREHNDFAGWSEVLSTAATVVSDPQVKRLIGNPQVAPEQLVGLIADVAGSKFSDRSKNFFDTLAGNRRLALLPEIAAMYEDLRAEIENVTDVQVTSAVPLDDAQRERLVSALRKRLRRDVRLHCDVDASLIGGAIVRSGDLVIDGSIKARLERLASEIIH